jgi:hypothetical protein
VHTFSIILSPEFSFVNRSQERLFLPQKHAEEAVAGSRPLRSYVKFATLGGGEFLRTVRLF